MSIKWPEEENVTGFTYGHGKGSEAHMIATARNAMLNECKKAAEPTEQILNHLIKDTSDDDTAIRKLAKPFLAKLEIYGDPLGVPTVVDVVEALVKRMEADKQSPPKLVPLSEDKLLDLWLRFTGGKEPNILTINFMKAILSTFGVPETPAKDHIVDADKKMAWDWEKEKSCCSICDNKKQCHICGKQTLYACSNCQINFGATVYVCEDSKCRDAHEVKCYGDSFRSNLCRTEGVSVVLSALEEIKDQCGRFSGSDFDVQNIYMVADNAIQFLQEKK